MPTDMRYGSFDSWHTQALALGAWVRYPELLASMPAVYHSHSVNVYALLEHDPAKGSPGWELVAKQAATSSTCRGYHFQSVGWLPTTLQGLRGPATEQVLPSMTA